MAMHASMTNTSLRFVLLRMKKTKETTHTNLFDTFYFI